MIRLSSKKGKSSFSVKRDGRSERLVSIQNNTSFLIHVFHQYRPLLYVRNSTRMSTPILFIDRARARSIRRYMEIRVGIDPHHRKWSSSRRFVTSCCDASSLFGEVCFRRDRFSFCHLRPGVRGFYSRELPRVCVHGNDDDNPYRRVSTTYTTKYSERIPYFL